jgi:C4-dicarboxylate-specific signal transduction histidine kinase
VQDMGGTLDLAPSDLGGARFEIRLPRNTHPEGERR